MKMEDKMARRKKEEEQDIFSLYKREKEISMKDDMGNQVEIVMVKITQGERQEILENYLVDLEETKQKILDNDQKIGIYTKSIDKMTQEQLVEGIFNYQKGQRSELVDLFPHKEEKKLTKEQRQKEEERLLKEWEENTLKELKNKPLQELKNLLRDITIDGLSAIEAGQNVDLAFLYKMCFYKKTRKRVFNSIEDVKRIADKRVIDSLMDALKEFRAMEDAKSVRKAADSDDFLSAGESAKS